MPAGYLRRGDLAEYRVLNQQPTRVRYRGLDVYGMAPSSSGGTTVGEALNILDRFPLGQLSRARPCTTTSTPRRWPSRTASAYVADPAFVEVPTRTLLSQRFADSRACKIPDGYEA